MALLVSGQASFVSKCSRQRLPALYSIGRSCKAALEPQALEVLLIN